MEAFTDLWQDGTWWLCFVVIAVLGIAGALGLLDRLEGPLER